MFCLIFLLILDMDGLSTKCHQDYFFQLPWVSEHVHTCSTQALVCLHNTTGPPLFNLLWRSRCSAHHLKFIKRGDRRFRPKISPESTVFIPGLTTSFSPKLGHTVKVVSQLTCHEKVPWESPWQRAPRQRRHPQQRWLPCKCTRLHSLGSPLSGSAGICLPSCESHGDENPDV